MRFDRPTAAFSGLAVAIAMLSQTASAETTPSLTLAPVIITGEKIERTQAESTTAVTALSDEKVDNGQFESVNDLTSLVPNVTEGAEGLPNVRGVSGTGAPSGGVTLSSGAKPRISTSIDGATDAYFGEGYNIDSLWDVEQVEFLRGPQSTLQGRSASAGAVIVNTKDPSFDFEAAVRTGYESADNKKLLAGMVSGPIIEDQLAFRLTAQGTFADSFIDYEMDSDDWPWDPEETTSSEVRGKLLWMPELLPDFSSQLTVTHRERDGEYMHRVTEPYSDYVLDTDLLTPPTATPPNAKVVNHRVGEASNTTFLWDADYVLSDSLMFYTTLSHADIESSFEQAGRGSGTVTMTMDVTEANNTWENRLVFDPTEGRLDGVIGTYVYQRSQDLSVDAGASTIIDGDDSVLTMAVYGEGTFDVTDRLSAIAGGRVENEHQKRDVIVQTGHIDSDIESLLFLPKAGFSFEFAPENTLTGTVRKGYTPGAGAVIWGSPYDYYEYDREDVLTYEALTHLTLLDGSVVIDGALFYNDYTDYQALLDTGAGDTAKIENLPAGHSYGVELSSNLKVTDGMIISGSMGLLATEVTESIAAKAELEGNEFANAPAFTARLGVEQNWSSGFFVSADTSYVGEYYSDVSNDESLTAGDYFLVNSAFGYEVDSYTIRLYAKNLTDEMVILSQLDSRGIKEARVGTPRTFGLTVDYRF